jgi:hypothetical protein
MSEEGRQNGKSISGQQRGLLLRLIQAEDNMMGLEFCRALLVSDKRAFSEILREEEQSNAIIINYPEL